jgi:acylphosphatase
MKQDAVRHVVVRGRVQGVGFRAWIEYEALKRDMTGWVRNRRDGSVEAVFAGPAAVVAAMIETCREGPPGSRVDAIDEQPDGEGALKFCRAGERFSVLPTL